MAPYAPPPSPGGRASPHVRGAASASASTSSAGPLWRYPALVTCAVVGLLLNAVLLLRWGGGGSAAGDSAAIARAAFGLPLPRCRGAEPRAASSSLAGEARALERLGYPRTSDEALAFIRDVVVPPWFPPPSADGGTGGGVAGGGGVGARAQQGGAAADGQQQGEYDDDNGAGQEGSIAGGAGKGPARRQSRRRRRRGRALRKEEEGGEGGGARQEGTEAAAVAEEGAAAVTGGGGGAGAGGNGGADKGAAANDAKAKKAAAAAAAKLTTIAAAKPTTAADTAADPDDPPDPTIWRLPNGPTATDPDFLRRFAMLDAYLRRSRAFRRRLERLRAIPDDDPDLGSGIAMVAGGKYYLPQAIVALRLLRGHAGSSLPVELFWDGPDEGVDGEALAWLSREFAPLSGRDARAVAAEAEADAAREAALEDQNEGGGGTSALSSHYAPHTRDNLKGFALKSFALLHTRFKRVLLLDCDVILLRDPRALFFGRGFAERGAWLWPDIYGQGMVQEAAYALSGLNATASRAVDAAKGEFRRHAESGQVLVDRSRHLDALEWAWLLNAHGHRTGLYKAVYGDKDTFALGYALAGKAGAAQHVPVPPAGVFSHRDTLRMGESAQLNKQGNWWLVSLWLFQREGGGEKKAEKE